MEHSDAEENKSCVDRLSRKEFLRRISERALIAGTLATLLNTQITVHPAVAQMPTTTVI